MRESLPGIVALVVLAAALIVPESAPETPDSPIGVQVRTARKHQSIDNFGASGAWTLDPLGRDWDDEHKNKIADLLFSRDKGIGLSLWRFNIGAGGDRTDKDKLWDPWRGVACFKTGPDAPYDWTRQAGQQWFLRAAKARGVEQTLAFVNSPPTWLTKNGHAYCDAATGTTNLKPGNERAFAVFLADVLAHFERQGLAFDYLSPINEPNWSWDGGQEGCRFGNDDIRRVLQAVDAELKARKLKTHLDALDSGDLRLLLDDRLYRTYRQIEKPNAVARIGNEAAMPGQFRENIRALLGDPTTRRILDDRISAHSYWTGDDPHDLDALRALLWENVQKYGGPDARYWQTEFCVMEHKRDLGMDTALRVARVIHADLSIANASAWHWWLAVSPGDYKDGLIYTDWREKGQPQTIYPSKTLWALGNFSRFLRPGSRRIDLSTSALPDDLQGSAYIDATGKRLVVVLINPTERAQNVRLAVDRRIGPMTPWITDASRDLVAGKAVAPGTDYAVPLRAVVTLVADLLPGKAAALPALPAQPTREIANRDVLYDVRCGETTRDTGGRRNSRADMVYGRDLGTGFRWGYRSQGESGAQRGVRYEDGDTVGKGLTYRFAVPDGRRYRVELTFADPWAAANRAMDVFVGDGDGVAVETGLIPGKETVVRTVAATPQNDELTVRIVRNPRATGPGDDPLIHRIRIWESNE